MGRNKHNALAAAAGRSVKDRHQRAARDNIAVARNLVAMPEKNIQSKHKSFFQFFENKDGKEKKLEYKVFTALSFPNMGFVLCAAGYNRSHPSSWIRILAQRKPRSHQCLQRALARARCHDLCCLGTLCSLLLPTPRRTTILTALRNTRASTTTTITGWRTTKSWPYTSTGWATTFAAPFLKKRKTELAKRSTQGPTTGSCPRHRRRLTRKQRRL